MKIKSVMTLAALIGSVGVSQAQSVQPVPQDHNTTRSNRHTALLATYDVNGDGKLDKEEALAMRQVVRELPPRDVDKVSKRKFSRLDLDKDGKLSDEEKAAHHAAVVASILERRATRFAGIAGEDGELSLEEFSALPQVSGKSEERVQSLFARLDANEDGSVTVDEFSARLGRVERPDRPVDPTDTDDDGDTVPTSPGGPDSTGREDVLPGDNVTASSSNGTVKFFNGTKGPAFITPDEGDKDVFVHVNGLIDEIKEGDTVDRQGPVFQSGPDPVEVPEEDLPAEDYGSGVIDDGGDAGE